ncbi:hypothetical protein BC827DRAFT_209081 [Russula dissimulans]|nr:hypothetical protein BC827DRAFT_209081 [Russula dissimulans]
MAKFSDIARLGFVQILITCLIPGDALTLDSINLFIIHYVLHAQCVMRTATVPKCHSLSRILALIGSSHTVLRPKLLEAKGRRTLPCSELKFPGNAVACGPLRSRSCCRVALWLPLLSFRHSLTRNSSIESPTRTRSPRKQHTGLLRLNMLSTWAFSSLL